MPKIYKLFTKFDGMGEVTLTSSGYHRINTKCHKVEENSQVKYMKYFKRGLLCTMNISGFRSGGGGIDIFNLRWFVTSSRCHLYQVSWQNE